MKVFNAHGSAAQIVSISNLLTEPILRKSLDNFSPKTFQSKKRLTYELFL